MRHIKMVMVTLLFTVFAKAQHTPVVPSTFVVCYGKVNPSQLSGIELAIVEPGHYDEKGVERLKATGAKILAYLSLTEINTAHPKFRRLRSYCAQRNENWNSYYIDIGNPAAQDILQEYAKDLMKLGYDGLFFDNLDNTNLWGKLSHQQQELEYLVQRLRDYFPKRTFVQNGGFHLSKETQNKTDYVLVESVVTTYDFKNNRYLIRDYEDFLQRLALIEKYQETYNKPVLVVEYQKDITKHKLIRRRLEGFSTSVFITTIDLQEIPKQG